MLIFFTTCSFITALNISNFCGDLEICFSKYKTFVKSQTKFAIKTKNMQHSKSVSNLMKFEQLPSIYPNQNQTKNEHLNLNTPKYHNYTTGD